MARKPSIRRRDLGAQRPQAAGRVAKGRPTEDRFDNVRQFEAKIVYRTVAKLSPNKRNPRTHNRRQRRLIARSIKRFGFVNPIVIDENGTIVAGHGRYEAAKELGLEEVPVVQLDHLNADERRAYVIADNQLATLAGWDEEILATELQYLVDINFDVELTGFEPPVVDHLIETQLSGSGSALADVVPELDDRNPPVTKLGDLWVLGCHALHCGNALDRAAFRSLLGRKKAEMVFTDPPWNLRIDGNVCGSGSIRHGEFVMASGEMSWVEYRAFLDCALTNTAAASRDGSIHYYCMDWRHIDLLVTAGREIYADFLNICIWNKTNAGMGSFYRSQHEFVCVFKNGDAPYTNNIQLGRNGRNRSNIWTYPGINSFKAGRLDELAMHPTVKPVALVADAIRDCTKRGGSVLDPFVGSGTTIIAAEETGRIAYAMELDPRYVDVAARRWELVTGEEAIHAETGQSFSEIRQARIRNDDPDETEV